MQGFSHFKAAVLCAALLFSAVSQAGVIVASDDAADAVYTDGWQSGDNGGSGMNAWTLFSNGGSAGHFVGTSTQNDNSGSFPNINTGGRSWALFANGTGYASASRSFSPLVTGGTVSLAMDNGSIASNKSVGWQLLDSADNVRFEFRFVGGDSTYSIYDGSVASTTLGFTRGGVLANFKATGTNTYTFTMTRQDTSQTDTLSRTLTTTGGTIAGIRLFNNGAGNGDVSNVYFNSIVETVPEPVAAGSILVVSAAMLRRRRLSV